jgi:hypothetical protein
VLNFVAAGVPAVDAVSETRRSCYHRKGCIACIGVPGPTNCCRRCEARRILPTTYLRCGNPVRSTVIFWTSSLLELISYDKPM